MRHLVLLAGLLVVNSWAAVAAFSPSPTTLSLRSSLVPSVRSTAQDQDVSTTHLSMPPGAHAPLLEINSPQELADFLKKDDRMCVIK